MAQPIPLSDEERDIYQWQMWTAGYGVQEQSMLKGSSVLISRVGGLGGLVAYELVAAGIGKLVLAHAGNVRHSDLNRQLLMTYEWLGKPRLECASRRLKDLNPRVEIVCVNENVTRANAHGLVEQVDLVVDCAPMFEERLAMNEAIIALGKPMVECAMFELEATLTTIVPGKTPCLACLIPEPPLNWRREFPVFGAVSGTVGCMAAMEAIKVLTGLGQPLLSRMLHLDLRGMQSTSYPIAVNPQCTVCAHLPRA